MDIHSEIEKRVEEQLRRKYRNMIGVLEYDVEVRLNTDRYQHWRKLFHELENELVANELEAEVTKVKTVLIRMAMKEVSKNDQP